MNLSYGSSGEEVRKLQEALNAQGGYGLDTDGVYGSKTQAAVRDYQSKNGLSVDGIAGVNTQGKLYGSTQQSQTSGTGTADTAAPEQAKAWTPTAYQESDVVKQAQEMLKQQMQNKPGGYQSQWQDTLNAILTKIQNREPFSYDLNGDALYQQYKDRYVQQGQQAMMDTMGQAAALTGGYGSSYAQNVGQQAYQGYLQGLNDKVPELYQLALDQYNQEGNDLYNQFSVIGQQENQDYGRYRDTVSDYDTELNRLYNQYLNEREYDYGRYSDDLNLQYQLERDKIADAQWKAEFDEAKRQYDQQYALSASKSSGGSGGGGGGGGRRSGGGSRTYSYTSNPSPSSQEDGSGSTPSSVRSAEIAKMALEYFNAHPNVTTDSRTMDMYLNSIGISGNEATTFKAYFDKYKSTSPSSTKSTTSKYRFKDSQVANRM